MQIHRLFEIVYILLSKKTATAKELSEHFEVSPRTIYRDIEILSAAGIPIYTCQGKGGGISLIEGFVLNKSVLSEKEQTDILSALQSMNAVVNQETENVLSKLNGLFNRSAVDWIEVDFSDWGCGWDNKFELLKAAILERRVVHFDYYSSYGEKTVRSVEPLKLWFKHKAWYLQCFCLDKMDVRTFKLSRMKNIALTTVNFEPKAMSNIDEPVGQKKRIITLKLAFSPETAYRVYDEFEEAQIKKNDDEGFIVTATYLEDEWVWSFILSFGHHVKVLEPEWAKMTMQEKLQKALEKY